MIALRGWCDGQDLDLVRGVVADRRDTQPLRLRPVDHVAEMDLRRVRRLAEGLTVGVDETVLRHVFEATR